jgi:hypothetical protein
MSTLAFYADAKIFGKFEPSSPAWLRRDAAHIGNLAFIQQHPKHVVPEDLRQGLCINNRGNPE